MYGETHITSLDSLQSDTAPIIALQSANEPIVEAPKQFDEKHAWIKNEESLLEPIWSTESIISNDLVDVVAHDSDTEEELDEIEEFEESVEACNEDESIVVF